jgi:cytochrome c553
MPKHIVRLLIVVGVLATLAYTARAFLTASSFYRYGHYRGNAVAEIASDRPKYKTPQYCSACHADQYAQWSQGVHNSASIGKVVKCEVCHGPAGSRDVRGRFLRSASGRDHPNNLVLAVPTDTTKLCTRCHEKIVARPEAQRQIAVASHAGTQQCATCHNPHSPKLLVAAAPSGAQRGDAVAGKAKATTCAACHGAEGISVNLPGPSLAGQKETYLVNALGAYRAGTRENPTMGALAKGLSDADISNVAAYFAGLSCKRPANVIETTTAAGRALASRCAACHGTDGVSVNPMWPNLAGQSKDYLLNALRAYRGGQRKDAIMSGVAKTLSDVDAATVAAHFAASSCK